MEGNRMRSALLAVLDIVEEALRDPQAYPWTPEDRVRIELAQDIGQAVNKALGLEGCACGHPWDMHGPEAPGCVECECEYIREGVTNE